MPLSAVTPRNFLIRGLLAGLAAGIITFFVGVAFGEPSIDAAIAIEEAGAAAEAAPADDGHDHSHGDEAEEEGGISRTTQKTWGLATAMIAVGPALGGLVGLAAAAAVGRFGRLRPAGSTAVVALVGFVSVTLVPFLKYPATPPAVGDGETIGARTTYYFVFLVISVVVAIAAVMLARALVQRFGATEGIALAALGYVVVMVAVGYLMPTVNEIGSFPGDVLWEFRRGSLLTLTTMWAVIGVVLTSLIGRLYDRESDAAARRALAESL